MNSVGIDVSKGKSMIAVMRPFGKVVVSPFEACHTASELSKPARLLNLSHGCRCRSPPKQRVQIPVYSPSLTIR